MEKKRKILLRFDDICPTMNWEQWNKAKSLLDSIGTTALLGVIPDCKDPDLMIDAPREDFWEYIRKLQSDGYAIAMHGYNHVFDIRSKGIVTPVKHSEFAGHPYEVQYEKIRKGKEVLEKHGIFTDVFFAPAHSYDDNTLKALAANGFKYISDGLSRKPYKRNGIICIPAHSGGIPEITKGDYYTAVIHAHEWVRPEKKKAWYKLENLCKKNHDEIVSFNHYILRETGIPYIQHGIEYLNVFMDYILKPTIKRILKR